VRFALDEAAEALRDAAAGVLRGYTPGGGAAGTRDSLATGTWDPLTAGVWDSLGAVGVLGTLVPADQGGLGLDENALVPLLEEIGYSGLPGPAVETIAVAAPLLSAAGLSVAGDGLVAVRGGDGDLIAYGGQAPRLVIDNKVFARGEVVLEECPAVDPQRPLARVVEVRARGVPLTGSPEASWQRGVLGTAALLCGLSRRMLDMTVEYVKRREQYGVPVGSFQAIKHALANALVAIEFARPAVLAAAWAQSVHAPDADTQTSAAKILASDGARLVARTAIQCHGAMGYTTEYDLHLFAKRVWALAPSWGGADWHRERILRSLTCQTT
jgi:alkylation response protein AidB-like acyl-CoA dehydrogenase